MTWGLSSRPEGFLTKVDAGEKFVMRFAAGSMIEDAEREVKAACDDKDNGYWYCVTHGKGFQNQFQKDGHIDYLHGEPAKARHRLVWICFAHGPEVP